jgi:hypothetical protein
VTRLPDNLDRKFRLYASKCSTVIFVSIDPNTRSGHHVHFPAGFHPKQQSDNVKIKSAVG